MEDMLESRFAEEVPEQELKTRDGKVWYLVHFAVQHKQKKKLRIVFDCSLKYKNVSLNDMLLPGPDLTNNLVGVLLRFRQGIFAYSSDIKSMYYQVRVPSKDTDFLRFLWFPNSDLNKAPTQYRLLVHVFGATSSPSCANFALQYTANSSGKEISNNVKSCILNSFYVDDLLRSTNDEQAAIEEATEVISLLNDYGFALTGFVSNSRTFLNSLPWEKLSKGIKELDLIHDELPYERALGVVWHTQRDTLGFRVNIDKKPFTKRGILSTLFSIYDPLFIACPVIISGKRIFQELCEQKIGWDEEIDEAIARRWKKWLDEIPALANYEIPRCFAPLKNRDSIQLHVFCDGSMVAYGAVAYIRIEGMSSEVSTCIVMAKAKLTPINKNSLKTVPRIELNAAKIAVILYQKIIKQIELRIDDVFFWSDSAIVLGYIKSEHGRFHCFVANRVAFICSITNPIQWNYIPSELNPADFLSRGCKGINNFTGSDSWRGGPEFLLRPIDAWPNQPQQFSISEDDMDVRRSIKAHITQLDKEPLKRLFESTSSWFKLIYRVAAFLRLLKGLKTKTWMRGPVTLDEMNFAEQRIWIYVQQSSLKDVCHKVKHGKLEKRHFLKRLNPYIDERGFLRVGGRISTADLDYEHKHPIILPKNDVVKLYCQEIHKKIGHLGKERLIAELRQRFYIVGVSSIAKEISRQCLICRKVLGHPSEQLMAELPKDRLTPDLPVFTNTGVDYFGPMLVHRSRGQARDKRYGVIFTCLASRAMHIEISHSLDTSSFISALRRFIARRGPIKLLRSDNGTNFISSNKEIRNCIDQLNKKQIDEWCKVQHIQWLFNPPLAPHFGGIWEREIRSVKKTLASLVLEFSNKIKITDETLMTLMCEIEDILNNRPLTAVSTDPSDLEALTPNHLLKLNSGNLMPFGIFDKNDIYHRRRWRQAQHMAEVFWHRWRREYLPLLLQRQKWTSEKRSFEVNDLVLVVDQSLPRGLWSTGRILKIKKDNKNLVRSAIIRVSRCKIGKKISVDTSVLERPISKLILLRMNDEL